MTRYTILSPLLLALAACGQSGEKSTTKLANVEVVEGTISDDMILLDTSTGDGTAIDTSATGDLYETIDNRPKAVPAGDKDPTGSDKPVSKAAPVDDSAKPAPPRPAPPRIVDPAPPAIKTQE